MRMQRALLHISIVSSLFASTQAQEPNKKDREAILAMAGSYEVQFHFHETVALAADYLLKKKPYVEHATEIIEVAENTPHRITLQNLLVVPDEKGKPQVIKHWAQVWTWQDQHILDYTGSEDIHRWNVTHLSKEQAAGTWSQLVTQTDDSPRYEGYGRWIHENGHSIWTSNPTRRPLPRREYTKRDDYDHLLATNRHTITTTGWIHEQDNLKVVERENEAKHPLCREFGINTYTRTTTKLSTAAQEWWKTNGSAWNEIRDFWIKSGEKAKTTFSYTTMHEGNRLSEVISGMEKNKSSHDQVIRQLENFIRIDSL